MGLASKMHHPLQICVASPSSTRCYWHTHGPLKTELLHLILLSVLLKEAFHFLSLFTLERNVWLHKHFKIKLFRASAPLLALLSLKRQTFQSQPLPAHFIKSTGFLSNPKTSQSPSLHVPLEEHLANTEVHKTSPVALYLTIPYGLDFWGLSSKCKIIGLLTKCAMSGQKKFSTIFQVSDIFLVKSWLQCASYSHRSLKSRCIKQCSESKNNWYHLCNKKI